MHFHATANGSCDLLRIGLEIVGYRLFVWKTVGMSVRELHAGESVVPNWTVGAKGVPPLGAPSLYNSISLENHVGYASGTEMLAHR